MNLSFLKRRWQKYSAFLLTTGIASAYLFMADGDAADKLALFGKWGDFECLFGGMFLGANVLEHGVKAVQAVKAAMGAPTDADPPTGP